MFSGNPVSWIGKIGLMYASDYGFSIGGNVRQQCLNKSMSTWGYYDYCSSNSWLYHNNTEYFMTPNATHNIPVWTRSNHGASDGEHIYSGRETRPTIFLKPNVRILLGTGSSEDPFQLEM